MENQTKIARIILKLTDMPAHKISYVIKNKGYVDGLRQTFPRYGIEYTKEVHDMLVDVVNDKLTGTEDIEYEWSEEQYENFVRFERSKDPVESQIDNND